MDFSTILKISKRRERFLCHRELELYELLSKVLPELYFYSSHPRFPLFFFFFLKFELIFLWL